MTTGETESTNTQNQLCPARPRRATPSAGRQLRAASALVPVLLAGLFGPASAAAEQSASTQPANPIRLAQASETREFSIRPQPLAPALDRFSEATGISFAYTTSQLEGIRSPGVSGALPPRQALAQLLAGTGITFQFTGADTVTLALAQEGDGPLRLGPITVEGETDNLGRLPTATANAGETTTATRLPVDSREVPFSVGVVDQQLVEETGVGLRNPGDLSAFISGVSQETNIARSGNFFVRGFPVGTRATIDGFRLPRRAGSSGTFTITDLALYERVEILKGASAILFGQGEPGGNVNYVTKKPQFERAHSIEVGVSRDDYLRTVVDTTGPLSDDIAYRVIAVAQNSNHFTPGAKDDRLIINPSVLWNLPTGGSFSLNWEYNQTDFIAGDNAALINGEITPFQMVDPTRDDFDNEFDTHNLRAQFEQPLTGQWTLVLDGSYSDQDHEDRGTFVFFDDPINTTQVTLGAFRQDRTDSGWGARAELHGNFKVGMTRHRLVVGAEYFDNEVDSFRTISGNIGTGPTFEPPFGDPLPAPLDPPFVFINEEEERGLYLVDQIDIGERIHLQAGLRYAEFESERADNGATIFDEENLSPSLGGVYDFTPQFSGYASWSQSFIPNRGTDINGGSFDPREGEQFEVGVKGDAFGERLFYTLALFDLTQTDVTTTDPDNPNFSAPLGEVNIRGVELDVSAEVTDRLSLIGAFTYHDSEITENNDGREGAMLANTPEFAATLRTSYRATDNVRVGGSLIHVGERQGADFGTPFEVDGYTRVDLDATFRVPQAPGLSLIASVENLFDEDYVLGSRSATQIQLGRPQTFTLRAKYDF